ncbi:MAG: class I SAM-dependent RNA methyltransferase [Oscillospiraceae bacterium]|nr:class I SAM-dependent RNA methyltransferase [Oscillospiraceae bacterium]
MMFRICCPCHFGLESVLKFELVRLSVPEITAADGRVSFSGGWDEVAATNVCLTAAERVLIELGSFSVKPQSGKTPFDPLFEGVLALPLEDFIGRDDAFIVKGSSLNSALSSVPACQKIIKKAAVTRLQRAYKTQTLPESGAPHTLQFQIRSDICTLYLDTTGIPLYKRGWRKQSVLAPIRETLAAGILDLSHVRSDTQLCDPFCGSGTFLIEGARRAMHIAPGLYRKFVCEQWEQMPEAAFRNARAAAAEKIDRKAEFHAFGFDRDPEAIALTLENAKKAGVADRITVRQQDIRDFHAVAGQNIVCNPPYGERMLDVEQAREIYRILKQVIPQDSPFSVITPDAEFEKCFGRKARKQRKLYNGMMQCRLYQYWQDSVRGR